MYVNTFEDIELKTRLSIFEGSDLFSEKYTEISNVISSSLDDKKLATTYAISSFVASKVKSLQEQIDGLKRKLSVSFVDQSGIFYMPDGLSSDEKTQLYRQLSTYAEPETSVKLASLSQTQFYLSDDQFVEIK